MALALGGIGLECSALNLGVVIDMRLIVRYLTILDLILAKVFGGRHSCFLG